jgi:hypothetical protein
MDKTTGMTQGSSKVKRSFLLITIIFFISACENADREKPLSEIDILRQQNQNLTDQLANTEQQAQQLKKQVQTLSAVTDNTQPEDIYDLQRVKIWRYTNLYDKDEDGKMESLIVYLQPVDSDGDVIKAAGFAEVQLWDLNRDEAQALLGTWKVSSNEIKKEWYATVLESNYRLIFDVSKLIDKYEKPLTVKVTFTDILSGKILTEQKIIKP